MRMLLSLLLGFFAFRLFRSLVGARPASPPPDAPRRDLDPDQAVRASWSEVPEDREGGPSD